MVGSDEFKDFIKGLLPMLMNFQWDQQHQFMDVTGLLREVVVMVHFLHHFTLTSYNSIEEAFSNVLF